MSLSPFVHLIRARRLVAQRASTTTLPTRHLRTPYNSVMPRISASIQPNPRYLVIIFIEGNRRVGPILRCHGEETVFQVLRRAHANLETINIVEMALRANRPCMVDLTLNDEQYAKLKG